MPQDVYTIKDIFDALTAINATLGEIVAQLKQVIHIKVVEPNAPPQWTGPTEFLDGVVGGTQDVAQFSFDPDGDPLTYSVSDNPLATMLPSGILEYTAAGEMDIEITIDDGKS